MGAIAIAGQQEPEGKRAQQREEEEVGDMEEAEGGGGAQEAATVGPWRRAAGRQVAPYLLLQHCFLLS